MAGNSIAAAHRAYRDNGASFKALLVSLLSAESFLCRTVPSEVPADDVAK